MILLANNFQDLFVNFGNERMIDFFVRGILNFISVFILIRFIYYPKNSQSENMFTFFQMALIIFFICSIMENVKIEFGLALGLFAVFSIIRFRTIALEMKELAYLFTALGLSVINALVEYNISDWVGLAISNFLILISAYFLDGYKPHKMVVKKALTFQPSGFHILNNSKLLKAEIERKTSLKVSKVEISKINAVKGEVTVWIYFNITDGETPQ